MIHPRGYLSTHARIHLALEYGEAVDWLIPSTTGREQVLTITRQRRQQGEHGVSERHDMRCVRFEALRRYRPRALPHIKLAPLSTGCLVSPCASQQHPMV